MHQQGGTIERHNRTMLETVRNILADSTCKPTHWPLGMSYMIYTPNRSTSKSCGIVDHSNFAQEFQPGLNKIRDVLLNMVMHMHKSMPGLKQSS
jgi:hypothetical protein